MPAIPTLPPIANEPLSVVLLAHNAAPHAAQVVEAWLRFLEGLCRDYELLFVDDGSSDGTRSIVQSLAAKQPRLRVLRHESHRGHGAALRTALAEAHRPLFFSTLCEPAYQPGDLGKLLNRRPDPSKPDREIDQVHLVSGYRAGVKMPGALRVL